MKLHLPKSLRKAVLACCFAAVGITTTVGTASIHGGMASFILTAQAAAEEMIISSSGDARLTSTPAGEQIIMQLDGGYLAGSQNTGFDVLADILIKVLRINDGNSYATYNFKGDITGDGVFERTCGAKSNKQTYVFTGDMSGYTGDMNLSKENDNSTIKFVGNQSGTGAVSIAAGNTLVVDGATMNNSTITSSGTMNVLHNATFNGAVSVNGSLNLGVGAGITNNGSFTFGDQSCIDFSNLTAVRNENRQIVYSLFTAGSAGSSNFNTLTQSNVTGLHASGSDWVFGADGSLTGTLRNNELHYTGGTLVWNNRDASFISPSGGASAFTAYDDVIFSGTTSATMAENVHAMRITVAEQGVLTINAAVSGTLKADEVIVLGTLKLNTGGQNGAFTGGIDVHGRLELTTGDVTGWSDSHGIKCINLLAGGEMHVGVGGNQNQTGAGLSINLQGGSITGVNEANFDLAYGGATYGYSSITALAAEDATPESPTLSSISGCGITLRQNATTIQVAEHARLDISSAIMQKSDYLNAEGAVPAGMNAGLTKTGAGELRLSGASTYTQATTVEEGTLTLLGGASLASPSITLKNDSLLQLDTLAGTHVALSGVLSGEGSILKQGTGSAAIAGGLADSFVGTIAVQGGSLRLGESLAINSGRELSLGTCGAVLDSDLSLAAGGRLHLDYSGTGPVTSLNQHTLTLSGDTELNLSGLVDPYGRTITLLTGISDILDSSGSSLSQDSSNKPLSDFFTISNPGLSYLENAALSFSDGNLQLLVSRRPVTTITNKQSGLVYERYQGICFENIASTSDGGAIYGGSNSTITLNFNDSVSFIANTVSSTSFSYSGAIYGGSNSTITLSNNGSVVFEGNAATTTSYSDSSYGGAIYGGNDSTITLNYNDSVSFIANTVSSSDSLYGGAIYGSYDSTITISDNGSVVFEGNSANSSDSSSYGGAIYGSYDSTITISDNGSVVFEGNSANSSRYASYSSYSYGGAIYARGDINIRNNGSVLFEKNVENRSGTYRLRSIYAGGTGNEISLSVAEDKSIEFRDSIYIASGSTVSLNADYVDETGVTHKQAGDIIFTGAYTKQHLNEFLTAAEAGHTATSSEILNSRTSEVYALTHLYGGRLRVEEGAIYKGHGITVHEGSAATVRVQNAELNHAGYDLTFHSGTSLELAGNNSLSGNLHLMDGSALIFDLSNGAGVTDIYGQMEWGENVRLLLSSSGCVAVNNTVLIYVDQEHTSMKGQSLLLPEGDTLTWVGNLLVLNYDADSFKSYFNGTRIYTESLLGNVRLHHYESLDLSGISGSVIYGGSNSTITLSNNGSVVFDGNSAFYGGAIYGYDNSTITFSNNGSVVFDGNSASYGGAIYGYDNSTITLSNNNSVVFEGNAANSSSDSYGGAIRGSTITLSNNGSVVFEGNSANSSSDSYGGAIRGSTITLSNNGSVVFEGNSANSSRSSYTSFSSYGGAISGGTITLSNNGSVVFDGNSAYHGGAIYGGYSSTITLSNNNSVVFEGTAANSSSSNGGAICGHIDSTITLSNNGSVVFDGNSASYGGAIYGYDNSTITLSNNNSVVFDGNTVSSSYSYGGAIYARGDINIRNNGSVLFEKNVENSSANYRLRSIYAGGTWNEISLSVAEDKSIEFRDSIYIASGSTVSLNADYVDETGVTHKQAGDIIFTGAYTEQHLNELLAAAEAGRTASAAEILYSRTSNVLAMTNLYGGRLRVEEGAIYKGQGITVHEGSAATVRVQNAELNHKGYGLTFHAGTVLELVDSNILTGNLYLHQDSSLVFDINTGEVRNTLVGSVTMNDGVRLSIAVDLAGLGERKDSEYDMVLLDATGADCDIGHWILESFSVTTSDSWGYKDCVEWVDGKLIIPLKQADTVTWTNAAGDFKWNGVSQNWSEGDFRFGGVNGAHVILGNTAAGTLELSGDIQLQSLKVTDNSAYELFFEKGASLSTSGELNVDEGSSLIVGNSMHAGSVANDGYLELHGGLTVQGAVQSAGLLSLEGALAAASLQSLGIAVDSLTLSDVDATNTVYGDLTVSGDVTVAGNLETTGNLSGADISVAGILSAANVSADNLRAASLQAASLDAASLELTKVSVVNTVDGAILVSGDVTVAGSLETTGSLCGDDISVAGTLSAANVSAVNLRAASLQAVSLEAATLELTEASVVNTVDGNILVSGDVTVAGSLDTTGNLSGADISVAGILSTANVSADSLTLTGADATHTVNGNILVSGNVTVAGSLESAGTLSGADISVAGALHAATVSADSLMLTGADATHTINGDITVSGGVSVAGSLAASGNLSGADISVAGALSAANVSADNMSAASLQAASLKAAALELTKASVVNTVDCDLTVNGDVTVAGSLETAGNLHASDISVAGALSAVNVSADSLTLTGADATHTVEGNILVSGNVTVAGSLESAGTLSGADISVAGALHAETVSADSLMLTGADATHTINGDVTVSGGVSVAGSLDTAGNLHASDISVAGALSAVNVSADSLTLTGADATHTVNGDVSVNGDVTVAGSLAASGNLSGADISVSGTLSAANLSAYSLELTHAGATNAVRGDLDVSTDVTVAGSLNVAGAARVAGAVKTGGVFSAAFVQTASLSAGSLQLTDAAGKSTIGGAVVLDGNAVVAGSLAALGEFSAQDVRIGGDLTVSSLQVNTVHADGTISITGAGMYNSVTEDLYADSVGLATGAELAVGRTLTAGEISFTGTAYTINAGALGKDCMNFELDRAALESLGLGYKQTGTIARAGAALQPGFVATLNGGAEAVAAAAYQYSISTSGSSVQLTADYAHDGLQVWYRGDWVGKSSWTDYYIAGYDAVNGVEQVDLNGQYVYGANLYVAYEDGVSAAVVSNGSLQFEYVDLGGGQLEIASDAAVTTNELYGKGETLVLHDGATLEATELTLGTLVLHDSGVTVKKATINTVGGTEGSLTIEARGSVTVKSDMTLTGLTNEGSLNMGKKNLTVNALVDVGGNVTAGEVSVQSRGSRMAEFDKLVADKVTVVNNVTTGRYTDDLSVGNGSAIGELVAETLEVREGTVTLGRTSGSTEMSLHYLDLQEDATLVLNRQTSLAVTKELTATENATVQLKQHASLDYDGVNISNRKESALSVNAYALSGETDLELNGAHVAATGSGHKMIDYKLVNSTVENAGSGTLQVTHGENSLAGIAASGGDVEVYNVSAPMNLQELHIAMGLNVSLMVGDVGSSMTPENEADVTVVGMAVFEQGATLNANLTLAAGSELRMDGPLHMGSSLELVAGEGTITLSGAMYDAVSSLELGESLTLFTGVDSLTLTNDSISVTYRPGELHSARADRYFGNLPVPGEERYYYITYTHTDECGGAVAITLNVPEPATATLSLLALAALATRRRRK